MAILVFFLCHWFLSLFSQTFFLHRYASHKMFKMNTFWERFFYSLTFLSQGSSFLNPRAYAILHRMHHAFSDTERDPHSPIHQPNVLRMMWRTKHQYDNFAYRRVEPEARFDGGYPEWPALDKIGQSWPMRITWGAAYTAVYLVFAPSPVWFVLLPAHYIM